MPNEKHTIQYNKPEDWLLWGPTFEQKAKTLSLWKYINPDGPEPWPLEPTEPSISMFYRALRADDLRSMRSSTATAESSRQTPTPHSSNERHASEKAVTFNDLVPEDEGTYHRAYQRFQSVQRSYELTRQNKNSLLDFICTTVCAEYWRECCVKASSLTEMYANLKRKGSLAALNAKDRERKEY
ncbi:hypothetical protein S40288_10013 [Stachybotrys chartarum IBT 40288]|nr:hypothetical protein S40288_10013 [Stachybotrys chartarum IBT 40288]